MQARKLGAVLFDAYGTLFDVHAVAAALEAWYPGKGEAAAALLREKQIEYTRLVTQSDPAPAGSRYYEPFWELTVKALRYASKRLDLAMDEARIGALMDAYRRLPAFPEAGEVLGALKARGLRLAILSNGDPAMLEAVVDAGGLTRYFDHLVSVAPLRQYKTAPAAYRLGAETLGRAAHDVLFVSSNAWDAVGAKWFGYRVFWVNRRGLPFEEIGEAPDFEGRDLRELLAVVDG
jgi:2-haloacid dehalogenase